ITPATGSFDPVLVNPARLSILTTLAAEGGQTFMQLTRSAGLSYGNLSGHTRRLAAAGLVTVTKQWEGERPVTRYAITEAGLSALRAHGSAVIAAAAARPAARACVGCGCTDERGCPGGCFWVTPDTCCTCAIRRLHEAGRPEYAGLLQACVDQMRQEAEGDLDAFVAAHEGPTEEEVALQFEPPRVWRPGDPL
ncbi:MAG TPA: transcriptional regulator, partial [Tepidisphaeraceae bacterium]|nr:transcriptional regulator [Tepidisphaeraceae bacterium]